jgi:predicted nucleic acid-binding protein
MIVVADTSPLNYLIQIQCDSLLQKLYEKVIVPSAVMAELHHSSSPVSVHSWLVKVPEWIEIHEITTSRDLTLAFLDPGERDAIQLAQEKQAGLLLIDEHKGRKEARRRGLSTTGTLGVLLAAGELSLIDAKTMYERLVSETSFRTTPELRAKFLGH